MAKDYKTKVNDEHDFQFSEEEIKDLDIRKLKENTFHILQQNKSFRSQIVKNDFLNREYQVKINSNTYNVRINNELDILIDDMGISLGNAQQVNDIKAPMPGLILEVNVKEGDEVKEGDYLLVLEAMKMENTLSAPRDGIVKKVTVSKGATVEKNELLIEME